jgi:hypothetical protein
MRSCPVKLITGGTIDEILLGLENKRRDFIFYFFFGNRN